MGGETSAGNSGQGNGKPVKPAAMPIAWLQANGFKRYFYQDEPFYWSKRLNYGAIYRHGKWWGLPEFYIQYNTPLEPWEVVNRRVYGGLYGLGSD